MNTKLLFTLILSFVFVGLMSTAVDAQRNRGNRGNGGNGGNGQNTWSTNPIVNEPLNEQEQQDVVFMREEEKLARDVYKAMFNQWGVRIFNQISESEQRHMDFMKVLIVRYDLDDPIVDDKEGVFTNPLFTELYEQLVADGKVSWVEALKVGALIEELDIVDLRNAIDRTDHKDVIMVYENLMRGSRNHLRAFASHLKLAGESYEAQYLTQEEFDEIANAPFERGNGQCMNPIQWPGSGNGAGMGSGLGQREGCLYPCRPGCRFYTP